MYQEISFLSLSLFLTLCLHSHYMQATKQEATAAAATASNVTDDKCETWLVSVLRHSTGTHFSCYCCCAGVMCVCFCVCVLGVDGAGWVDWLQVVPGTHSSLMSCVLQRRGKHARRIVESALSRRPMHGRTEDVHTHIANNYDQSTRNGWVMGTRTRARTLASCALPSPKWRKCNLNLFVRSLCTNAMSLVFEFTKSV